MTRPSDPDWLVLVDEISEKLGPERLQLAPIDYTASGEGRHWSWVWPDLRLMIQRWDQLATWKVTVIRPTLRITAEYDKRAPTVTEVRQLLITAGVLPMPLQMPHGGQTHEMFAAFRDRGEGAVHEGRGTAFAARYVAEKWGGDAYPARSYLTVWPNGAEYQSAWVEIADDEGRQP